MTEEEIITGNTLIVDFLAWEWHRSTNGNVIWIPNNYPNEPYTGVTTFDITECRFNSDWNWLHDVWHDLYRKVLIPTNKDNPRLKRELNYMIKKMRNALMYSHIGGAYEMLIVIIKWYNKQLGE